MKRLLIFIAALVFAVSSCDKSEHMVNNQYEGSISADDNAESLAVLLSSALNNSEILAMISEISAAQFDGDNNFLLAEHLTPTTSRSTRSLYELLKTNIQTRSVASESDNLDEIINNIVSADPLLQIYLMNDELLNNGIPPVIVCLPEEYDDAVSSTLVGYDLHSNRFTLSSEELIEDRPVIVLSRNERTIAVENSRVPSSGQYMGAAPYYVSSDYHYYLKEDFTYPEEIATGDIIPTNYVQTRLTTGKTEAWAAKVLGAPFNDCHRFNNYPTKDYIKKVTIASKSAWKDMESGWLGDPDLYVYVIYGDTLLGYLSAKKVKKYIGTGYKNRNNIQWCDKDIDVIRWSLLENGDMMKYAWYDDDGGSIISIPITAEIQAAEMEPIELTATVEIGNKDEEGGTSLVYYYDAQSTIYNTGWVKFQIDANAQ